MAGLDIARRRMRNSRLTGPGFTTPEEVVRWHLAMQAQDYGPAKWSVGRRATRLVDDDLDAALTAGSIVRTHVLRPTWHFVARGDVRWLLALTGPRVQRGIERRYRELGLDPRTRARCERVIAAALEGGNELTRAGIAAALDDAGIDRAGQRLPHILMHCELEALICSGGRSGTQHAYALLDERVPNDPRGFDRDDALTELTRRYLAGHGPASVKDLSWWSGLPITDVRKALDALGPEVRSEEVGGLSLRSLASDAARTPAPRGAHLLHVYDELLVGYTESRFAGDPRAGSARAAWSDRTLPNGVVLVKGAVAGHWRRTAGPTSIGVQALLYERPGPVDLKALEAEAERLGRFVGRPVTFEAKRL